LLVLTNTKETQQYARNLKEKLQKGTRQIKDIITEKTKERGQGKKDAWTIPT
jgi:hypothetical protein